MKYLSFKAFAESRMGKSTTTISDRHEFRLEHLESFANRIDLTKSEMNVFGSVNYLKESGYHIFEDYMVSDDILYYNDVVIPALIQLRGR